MHNQKKALAHFSRVDKTLYSLAAKINEPLGPRKSQEYFSDLCETIICQQLSDKAGATIFARFQTLFKGKITPRKVLNLPDKTIRTSGPSWAKVKSLKQLATQVQMGNLDFAKLEALDDAEVIKELTMVKGIGPWTAEMFLMFSLGREDVFSYGDVGLQNAIKKLYGIKDSTRKELEPIVSLWSPYRTYACLVLWKSL